MERCGGIPGGSAKEWVCAHKACRIDKAASKPEEFRPAAGFRSIERPSAWPQQRQASDTISSRCAAARSGIQIGRASCRERVCRYGEISVVAATIKTKINKKKKKK